MTSEENKANTGSQELFLVKEYRDEILQKILELEKICFPEEWQYDDPPAYFRKRLEQPQSIHMFLKENDEIVGYCLAVPLKEEVTELREYDSDMEEKDNVCYIESVEIMPNSRGKGGVEKLLRGVCEEAKKRGVKNFAVHARKLNKLNEKIKKIFEGKVISTREIEHWAPALGEAYEYIEWQIE